MSDLDEFSVGLSSIMSEIKSKSNYGNEEMAEMLLKPEDGVKYIARILVEQNELVLFSEHNFVPVLFTKKSGEKVPGFNSFFCTKQPDCPVCKKKIVKDDGTVANLKPRQVLAIPLFIKEQKSNKKNKDITDKVEETKILILPPGRNQINWNQFLEAAELRGTLKDRYYVISRTGKGLDTTWSIQSLDKEPFEYEDEVEIPDTKEIIRGSGRWKKAEDILNMELQSEENDNPEVKERLEKFSDISNDL